MFDTIGERLKYARNQKNLTQDEVCKLVDIAKAQTLSAYERNVTPPPLKILKNLSNLYQISIDWIVCGKEFEKTTVKNADLIEILLDCANRLGLDMGWERDFEENSTGRRAIWLENDTLVGFNELMDEVIQLREVQKFVDNDDYRMLVHKRITIHAMESDDFAQLPDDNDTDDNSELPF